MKNQFKSRSRQKEIMDSSGVSVSETLKNLNELDIFNKITGSIYLTLIKLSQLNYYSNKGYHVADIGCGGGEFIRSAAKWARTKNLNFTFSGVDNNPVVIDYMLRKSKQFNEIKGYCTDYKNFLDTIDLNVDIIHCSLFCHHLEEVQIIKLIQKALKMQAVLVINDLHRSAVAYYGAIALTRLFNGTALAKSDGPISVSKGFTKNELLCMCKAAGATNIELSLIPFFRFLLVIKPVF